MESIPTYLLVGNMLALVGSIWLVLTGLIKDKTKTLYSQIGYIGVFAASNFVLGGYAGALVNIVNCLRNIFYVKGLWNNGVKWAIVALSVVLPLAANQNGWLGVLPVVSSVAYVLLMDIKDPLEFKGLLVSTIALWAVYDFAIMSYTAFAFDIGFIISNGIGAWRIVRDRKKEESE